MPIHRHVTHQIEAYVDDRLSPAERKQVKEHISTCVTCAQRLFDAQRLTQELGPVTKIAFGQPVPPPALRQKIKQQLAQPQPRPFIFLSWQQSGQILQSATTFAGLALLVVGLIWVINSQKPPAQTSVETVALPLKDGEITPQKTAATPEPTPIPVVINSQNASLGDTLIIPPTYAKTSDTLSSATTNTPPQAPFTQDLVQRQLEETSAGQNSSVISEPALNRVTTATQLTPPKGTIAFAAFNPNARQPLYETHLISPDGSNHRLFELDGVSEPALKGDNIAYRAWGETTAPRALISNKVSADFPEGLTNFWEDAQPDWSPTDHLIIFASQREIDRKWRLYTSWGDGSMEVNLRREGKSPTFAPDGYHFAFESCAEDGQQCGLWLANLENSEHEAEPFLEDSQAKSPDWSPTSDDIAYMSNADGNWDLYLIKPDGSQGRRLTTDPAIDGLPTWSPDGEWVAFLSNRGDAWGIWLLHVETGHVQSLFTFEGLSFEPPIGPPYGERHWWDEQLSWSQ
ncbi:MAG: zf-HC2 domain-containing protein [Chloroflexota bacterium]